MATHGKPEFDGRVTSWREEEGFGEIALDDGRLVWAHFSAIVLPEPAYRSLRPGARVTVRVRQADQDGYQWVATKVVSLPAGGA